jgi:hypothetical protein
MKAFGSCLVLKVEPVAKKIGSLIMPETAKKKIINKREGVIIDLGEVAFESEVGDRIIYDRRYEMFEENGEVLLSQEEKAILYNYGTED